MCPPKLFLLGPVPTEPFSGCELLPGEQSRCQGWGWTAGAASLTDSLAQAASHPDTY